MREEIFLFSFPIPRITITIIMINLSTEPQRSGIGVTKKSRYTADKKENNAYNREYGSSPVFPFQAGEIIAGAEEVFDFYQDKPAMQKYGSFTNFVIQNNSSTNLTIYLNQDRNRQFFIPAGTIRSFEKDDIQGGVLSLIIKNSGSATANANEVSLEVFKVGTQIESTFKKLHKKFFKLGGF